MTRNVRSRQLSKAPTAPLDHPGSVLGRHAMTPVPKDDNEDAEATSVLQTIAQNIGGVLRVVRGGKLLTQEELAAALSKMLGKHIDQSVISKIETNDRQVTGVELIAFCHALGCDFNHLLAVAKHLDALQSATRGDVLRAIVDHSRRPTKSR